ncbi:kelch domain-containing protein 9 isoform 2-T2 [Molossus nigricans]
MSLAERTAKDLSKAPKAGQLPWTSSGETPAEPRDQETSTCVTASPRAGALLPPSGREGPRPPQAPPLGRSPRGRVLLRSRCPPWAAPRPGLSLPSPRHRRFATYRLRRGRSAAAAVVAGRRRRKRNRLQARAVREPMAGAPRWTWRPAARDALLARAFHSCTELRGRLYLVGGLLAGGATEPSGDTVVWDPAEGQAERVGARGGPRRSHHDAAALGGRWLCAVGGWDGSRRVATVAALDTERGEWEPWTAAPGSCPPAGLSSHTCTRLSDRELRVAGREGGTRTQRRYGSIYLLKLDPGARTYCYKEESYHSVSRSGHCAALLPTPGPRPGHQLLLVGGCSSAEPEVAGHWSYGRIKEEPSVAPRLTEQLAKLVSSGQGSPQGPRGLRHQSCSVVGPFAVLFGGETLTRARDTVCNDLYVCDARTAPPLWFHFPCADRALKRVGHRTCLWNDQLYLVGGFGEDGRTASPQVCTLDLFI